MKENSDRSPQPLDVDDETAAAVTAALAAFEAAEQKALDRETQRLTVRQWEEEQVRLTAAFERQYNDDCFSRRVMSVAGAEGDDDDNDDDDDSDDVLAYCPSDDSGWPSPSEPTGPQVADTRGLPILPPDDGPPLLMGCL